MEENNKYEAWIEAEIPCKRPHLPVFCTRHTTVYVTNYPAISTRSNNVAEEYRDNVPFYNIGTENKLSKCKACKAEIPYNDTPYRYFALVTH